MMEQSSRPFDVVRCYDPAIDDALGRMRAEYAIHRDISKLRFREGEKPIVFKCRRLTRQQRRRCQEASSDAARNELAFAFGVLEIRDLPINAERPELGVQVYTPHRASPELQMSDDSLDRVGDVDIQEIGAVIWHTSFLAVGLPLRVPLLPTSQDACLQVLARLAERTRASETREAERSGSTETSE